MRRLKDSSPQEPTLFVSRPRRLQHINTVHHSIFGVRLELSLPTSPAPIPETSRRFHAPHCPMAEHDLLGQWSASMSAWV